jgi:hypothetical protein
MSGIIMTSEWSVGGRLWSYNLTHVLSGYLAKMLLHCDNKKGIDQQISFKKIPVIWSDSDHCFWLETE